MDNHGRASRLSVFIIYYAVFGEIVTKRVAKIPPANILIYFPVIKINESLQAKKDMVALIAYNLYKYMNDFSGEFKSWSDK